MTETAEFSSFKKMLMVSMAIHAGILLMATIRATFFPHESISYESAVKVDLIDLPDKVMAPAEPSQNTKSSAPPAKPKDQSIDLKKKKTSSIEKIKQFEKEERKRKALESIRDEVRKQDLQEKSEKVKKLLAKGNVISAGTALTGTAKTEFNEYIGVLHSTVQEHWNLPEWLSNANLKATVVVYLDSQGNIKKRAIEKSSGDSRFDQYSLKAVDDSAPFPPPPEKFRDIVSADGIRFRFPQ